jgi:hypothetical protein
VSDTPPSLEGGDLVDLEANVVCKTCQRKSHRTPNPGDFSDTPLAPDDQPTHRTRKGPGPILWNQGPTPARRRSAYGSRCEAPSTEGASRAPCVGAL